MAVNFSLFMSFMLCFFTTSKLRVEVFQALAVVNFVSIKKWAAHWHSKGESILVYEVEAVWAQPAKHNGECCGIMHAKWARV